jgi:hypothetical protein
VHNWEKNPLKVQYFRTSKYFTRHCFGSNEQATTHAHVSQTPTAHAQKDAYAQLCKTIMAEDIYETRISSCFMHFDGVTEQLCKVTRQRLKKFLECRSKWAKLKCEQAEIAKKSYDNIDDGSVNSYMEKNPESINLEWYHHMKCYKKFCDEEKIRRQQKKEEKGEGTSSKTITSTEVPHVDVEPIEPRRKLTRQSVAEGRSKTLPKRNEHVLPEICIVCGRDSSWFSLDKVWSFIQVLVNLVQYPQHSWVWF